MTSFLGTDSITEKIWSSVTGLHSNSAVSISKRSLWCCQCFIRVSDCCGNLLYWTLKSICRQLQHPLEASRDCCVLLSHPLRLRLLSINSTSDGMKELAVSSLPGEDLVCALLLLIWQRVMREDRHLTCTHGNLPLMDSESFGNSWENHSLSSFGSPANGQNGPRRHVIQQNQVVSTLTIRCQNVTPHKTRFLISL